MSKRFLGTFINPWLVQSEGLNRMFDNLEKAGFTALVTHHKVAEPVEYKKGFRFPPLHVDGYKRILARPVWGKKELHIRTYPAFKPDLKLYESCFYKRESSCLSIWQ